MSYNISLTHLHHSLVLFHSVMAAYSSHSSTPPYLVPVINPIRSYTHRICHLSVSVAGIHYIYAIHHHFHALAPLACVVSLVRVTALLQIGVYVRYDLPPLVTTWFTHVNIMIYSKNYSINIKLTIHDHICIIHSRWNNYVIIVLRVVVPCYALLWYVSLSSLSPVLFLLFLPIIMIYIVNLCYYFVLFIVFHVSINFIDCTLRRFLVLLSYRSVIIPVQVIITYLYAFFLLSLDICLICVIFYVSFLLLMLVS